MKKSLSIGILLLSTTVFADWNYGEIKIGGRPLIHQMAKNKKNKEFFVGIGKVVVGRHDDFFLFVKNSLGQFTDDVTVKIDNGETWYLLNPSLHSKQVGLSSNLISEMKKGKIMRIIVSDNEENPVIVDLNGFSRAMSKLEK